MPVKKGYVFILYSIVILEKMWFDVWLPFISSKKNKQKQQPDSPQRLQNSNGSTGGTSNRSVTTTPGPIPEPPSPPGGNKNRDLKREAQDAINAILPPKEWTEDDQVWRQLVDENK